MAGAPPKFDPPRNLNKTILKPKADSWLLSNPNIVFRFRF